MQLDLSIEARHLDRFNRNFRHWRHVTFPKPLHPLVTPSVLVETFEEGRLISYDVNQDAPAKPTEWRITLAETGLKL
jgi:aarF domain-containing kinase